MNKMNIVLVLAIIAGLVITACISCATQEKYPNLLFDPKDTTQSC